MAYIPSFKNQNWLLPTSIRQMIPTNHICFFIEEFVESLDFSKFELINEGAGHPAYHPSIVLKIIIQGMLSKERSSRKLAAACRENFIFMYLAEKVQPNFRTIARFRKNNSEFIKMTFQETIKLAASYSLVDLKLICIDGSKMKANASKKTYIKKTQLDELDDVIDKMIEEDIQQDKADEKFYGEKEENITSLDEKNLKEIVKKYRQIKDKNQLKEKCAIAREEFKKNIDMKKISLSDPECRMMKSKKGFYELGYNPQFSVDSKNQIILANDVCQDGNDSHQLQLQIINVQNNIKIKKDTKIAADCSYNTGENLKFLEDNQLSGYIPTVSQSQIFNNRKPNVVQDDYEYDWINDEIIIKKIRLKFFATWIHSTNKRQRVYKSEDGKMIKKVPEFFRERLRMKEKMNAKESKYVYGLRKTTVEPVIGNIKQNLGFTEFMIRGLNGARIELNIASIVHNLKKIWIAKRNMNSNSKMLIKNRFLLNYKAQPFEL
jgi:transposase